MIPAYFSKQKISQEELMKLKALKTAFPNTLPIFTGFLFLSLAGGTICYMLLMQFVF